MNWQPSSELATLHERARIFAEVRAFFAERGVLEVETPLLGRAGTSDPQLESFTTQYFGPGHAAGLPLYLHTSPEFAMKRLLAAGSGPIYQICKVFRQGEAGRRHNPEFSMLEWYRPGWDHHRLMDEVEALVAPMLGLQGTARRLDYRDVFVEYADIDPLEETIPGLRACAQRLGCGGMEMGESRDGWLDLILSHHIEPQLGRGGLCFLQHYPASQAALARLSPQDPRVAERFELYYQGIELANGFHELSDAAEQARRFEQDLATRRERGLAESPIDEALLAALADGLPDCAGVALGLDRLIMLALGIESIGEVQAFDFERC
ncbi:MAG: EF-P lysine aminoacylase EpmA [Thiohalomonadaceae bacterium]